jgi:ATP-binding cassette subfamily B protein
MGFTQLFSGVITILGTVGFMLYVSPLITLVVVVLTPMSLLVARYIASHTYRYFRQQTVARGDQTAFINEMIEGMKVVQSFGYEEVSQDKFDGLNRKLTEASRQATFYSSLTNPVTRFVNSITYAAVARAGALYAISGGISIGQLSVF